MAYDKKRAESHDKGSEYLNALLVPEGWGDDINWTEVLRLLAIPFERKSLFWRAGVVSRDKKRAQALPYAEPRGVRSLYDKGVSPRSIAAQYGVTKSNVVLIGKRRTWAHLPEEAQ